MLELDPTLDKALTEAIELRGDKGDHEGVERLLKVELERASDRTDTPKVLESFDKLGALYKDKLGWMGDAIDAYEAAQSLDPDNDARNDLLAKLYASDPAQYLDKAVAAQAPILKRHPYKPDACPLLLRKLYTSESKPRGRRVLPLPGARDHELRRARRGALLPAHAVRRPRRRHLRPRRRSLDELHPPRRRRPAAHGDLRRHRAGRAQEERGQLLESLGYGMTAYALDLVRHPYPMSQTINYSCSVLGMAPPLCFQNPDDPGGLSFLHAHTPGIVLGAAALAAELPAQAGAFIAARHLTYYRPGLYLRHLVPTGTGLRAWLFAAIKLITPAFPIAKELEGQVKENLAIIDPTLVGPARELLASAVTKLLGAGAIDLKKWVAAVDLSADRAGFIVANDLELCNEVIKAADEASSAVPQKDRLKELNLYAVSEQYFAVRQRLGINIDA